MRPAVAYIRVSKPKQGRSGLGLEAQQAAIRTFCAQHGYNVEAEYREVETGKGADALERRPELAAAMKFARKLGKGSKARAAPVIIAKLDRLSRDVHFISGLMVQRVPFIVTELDIPRYLRIRQTGQSDLPGFPVLNALVMLCGLLQRRTQATAEPIDGRWCHRNQQAVAPFLQLGGHEQRRRL